MSISGYSCALWIALVYVFALIKRPFPLLSLSDEIPPLLGGLAQAGVLYRTADRRVQAGMLVTWRTHSLNFNTPWELSLKVSG